MYAPFTTLKEETTMITITVGVVIKPMESAGFVLAGIYDTVATAKRVQRLLGNDYFFREVSISTEHAIPVPKFGVDCLTTAKVTFCNDDGSGYVELDDGFSTIFTIGNHTIGEIVQVKVTNHAYYLPSINELKFRYVCELA